MAGRITWIGHATALIELDGVRLLTDPLLRNHLGHLRRHGPAPDPEALRHVDAVLISHLHFDHLDVPSLRRLPRGVRMLVPRGAGGFLRRQGFPGAEELAPGDRADVGGVAVAAVPAVHDRRRRPYAGGPEADAIGFVAGGRVYFAGDTDLFDEMAAFAGRVDVALLPVAGWGPRLPEGHLGPETAAQAAALIRPAVAVPIHWGTMRSVGARADGDARAPALAFAAAVEALGLATAVRILMPGEAVSLPAAA